MLSGAGRAAVRLPKGASDPPSVAVAALHSHAGAAAARCRWGSGSARRGGAAARRPHVARPSPPLSLLLRTLAQPERQRAAVP
jgi:hypothetical protein